MAPAATLNARADLDIGDAGEADGVAGSLASARCSDVTRTTAMDTAEFEQRSVALDRARRAAHGDLGRLLDVSQRITQSLDASLALGERQSGSAALSSWLSVALVYLWSERLLERTRCVDCEIASLTAQLLHQSAYAEMYRISDRQLEIADSLVDALNKLDVLESSQAAESGRREVLLAARVRLAAAYRQAVGHVTHCEQRVFDAVLDLVLGWRAAKDALRSA